MRWPLSLAAVALACCTLALPAGAQVTVPDAPSGDAAAPAPAETAPTLPTTTPPAETTTVPPATTPTTTATAPAPAAPAPPADGDDDVSPWLVGLGVLVALSLIALALWLLARLLAWEPTWLLTWRHAVGEAGYRTGLTWAEFRDWVRLRR